MDDRLRMMFACTHPSLEASVHAPLMLQSLLGLSAARIAGAFLVAPAAMSQRLVRAKTKLREEGVDFSMPGRVELVSRLPRVLEAIYAAYSASHDDAVEAGVASELADEAVDLARLVTDLLDDQPEAWGLRSLVVLSRARRDARRDGKGRYVPLPDQDCDLWDRELVQEGEWCLLQAAEKGPGSAGRFALQAAIQSVHVDRMRTGQINWTAIVGFYEALLAHSPSVGATIGLSAGLLMRGDPHRALLLLDGLPMNRVKSHQPFWAVRAETLRALGRFDKSSEAFQLAIGLSRDAAVRAYLLEQQTQMRS